MITAAVRAVLPDGRLRVTVGMPGGEETARRTFNGRLGIEGGLSDPRHLGSRRSPSPRTPGCARCCPRWTWRWPTGASTVYLTPGTVRRARRARAVRRRGDADRAVLQLRRRPARPLRGRGRRAGGARRATPASWSKVAAGVWNTHSRVADARLETLAALAAAAGAAAHARDRTARPADHRGRRRECWPTPACRTSGTTSPTARRAAPSERAARRAGDAAVPRCDCAVVDYAGEVIGRSAALRAEAWPREVRCRRPRPRRRPPRPPPSSLASPWSAPARAAAEWLTPAAWRAIHRAEVVVGGRRQLERFAPAGAERVAGRRRHGRGRRGAARPRRPPRRGARQRRPRLLRHPGRAPAPAAGGGDHHAPRRQLRPARGGAPRAPMARPAVRQRARRGRRGRGRRRARASAGARPHRRAAQPAGGRGGGHSPPASPPRSPCSSASARRTRRITERRRGADRRRRVRRPVGRVHPAKRSRHDQTCRSRSGRSRRGPARPARRALRARRTCP